MSSTTFTLLFSNLIVLIIALVIAPKINCNYLPFSAVFCPSRLPVIPQPPPRSSSWLILPASPKNLALSANGAIILPALSSIGRGRLEVWLTWALWVTLGSHYTEAGLMLNGNIDDCWTIPSKTAQIAIRLSDCMVIHQLTIAHSTARGSRDHAPHDLIVWGFCFHYECV